METTATIDPADLGQLGAAMARLRAETPLTNRQVVKKGYIAYMLSAAGGTPKNTKRRAIVTMTEEERNVYGHGHGKYAIEMYGQRNNAKSGERRYLAPVWGTKATARADSRLTPKRRGLAKLTWKKLLAAGTKDASTSTYQIALAYYRALTSVTYDATNKVPYVATLDGKHRILDHAERAAAKTIDWEIKNQAMPEIAKRWARL